MTVFAAQVSLNRSSNIPRDRIVNTFHFGTPDPIAVEDGADIVDQLTEFYNVVVAPGSLRLFDYMGGLSTLGHRIKVYDLADPQPRAPIIDTDLPATSVGSTGLMLPAEVALCLSYAANPVSGVPLAQTRGRVYLGPWAGVGTVEGTALDADARPALTIRQVITNAAKRMMDATAGEPVWGVYSSTTDTFREARTAWVDDAWDTQRRRGASPTTRTTVFAA